MMLHFSSLLSCFYVRMENKDTLIMPHRRSFTCAEESDSLCTPSTYLEINCKNAIFFVTVL